jgi:hypothetical protein
VHTLVGEAEALRAEVVDLRRAIHREPELGLELPRTQARVLAALRGLPLDVRQGQRTTSVVADLRGGASGRTLILCAAQPQPAELMRQAEFERHVGRENICPNIVAALVRAEVLYLNLQLAGH